jgi:hypothetical protein
MFKMFKVLVQKVKILESKVTQLEIDEQRRRCKEGKHSEPEMITSATKPPYVRCKSCWFVFAGKE